MKLTLTEIKTRTNFCVVTTEATRTVGDLKKLAVVTHGLTIDGMRVIWNGQFLDDCVVLEDAGITNEAQLKLYTRGFQMPESSVEEPLPCPAAAVSDYWMSDVVIAGMEQHIAAQYGMSIEKAMLQVDPEMMFSDAEKRTALGIMSSMSWAKSVLQCEIVDDARVNEAHKVFALDKTQFFVQCQRAMKLRGELEKDASNFMSQTRR